MANRTQRPGRSRLTILVMVLASITVLTLDAKDVPVLGSVRSAALDVLSPVGSAFKSAARPFRNAWRGVTDYGDLERENRELRDEIDELRGRSEANDGVEAENEKLREQLGLKQELRIPTIVARVATGNFTSFDDNTAIIDVGSEGGVKVGNPVVTKGGLVGRVERVSDTRAVVRLITDPDLKLGIKVKSNDIGTGRGTGAGKPFLVDSGIDLSDDVAKKDLITTAGTQDSLMPGELPIGTVTKITRNQADQVQVLEVELSADLSRLDFVQVLNWVPSS